MKLKSFQITCVCSAYNFPHRLGGGSCSGSEWAESYKTIHGEYCKNCNCLTNFKCDVVKGAENISECEAFQTYLHYQINEKLPINKDELFEAAYRSHYEE